MSSRFMKEIEDARAYSQVVAKLQRNHRQYPCIHADAVWEELVRADSSRYIVKAIPMPPPIQALHTERWALWDDLQYGENPHVRALQTRLHVIQLSMAKWLHEEQKNHPPLMKYLPGREFEIGVGAKWRTLFVQVLSSSIPRTRELD